MHPREKALSQLRKSMRSEDRGEELTMPMQKVSVMADSKKGLEEGLDKAEDILGETDDLMSDAPELDLETPDDDLDLSPEMESVESENDESLDGLLSQMQPEQLKALLMKIKSLV